ncbi:hypothetical protein A3C09_00985 [Candidatus Uhrbacteria bacterium RIFCSPHIGHO2_02_FULL_47_44]|uniref:Tellurium resistance protein TerC n=1 Tax=Candidatus Uhrbacteria bacterium RIFCSPLOWO2_02_FULL_48_18 TaxID=1802408 RepID=A0A1F7V8B7_9BACT|nr:MAG: hypothetical protein A2839_02860 [Candidatus Uhrbacteria bacterium RIFCSPHIGHO2_01_FULL_47_10]OGL70668.1 MAG: hypothetical protein A3C09_00985 [Candidatus Uhrbacteria bacterium RIFCSPHIGHO2_02_FULL_47_44]OGL75958.1 MAG: hypothetical protein A3E97_04795 [Candidatus Uhrbacteria bacterium RIFCSPHIGHO2_12_FULL_47_12]OGL82249.1 MAG: hypothetical protein A3B20_00660 [Candidatus Uhrbacteria bacterium RIFCSPLOWO2_01_FULL_47_17]OGL86739.1 MAG: hypothetical protein A3I41_05425 [Candidatus Uhrbact
MVENIIAFLTLVLLEVVLGFDNIVMVAINVSRLPAALQKRARTIGMAGALLMRVGLLCTISWVMGLVQPVFTLSDHAFSWRDLILIMGGLFLVYKASTEVFREVEGMHEHHVHGEGAPAVSFNRVLVEIMLLDAIFSLDSVITAVGMAKEISIMIAAVVVSMIVMIIFAKVIGDFIQKHTSVKVLALSFLVLIGAMLIAEGCGKHVEKGYIYGPMAFASFVIGLELRRRSKAAKRGVVTRNERTQLA